MGNVGSSNSDGNVEFTTKGVRRGLVGPDLAEIARRCAEVARERYGLADADVADRVGAVSRLYVRERAEGFTKTHAVAALDARLRFFLPRDLAKVWLPLSELAERGLIPSGDLRVLDLGCGLGTTSLGLASFVRGPRTVRVDAIDHDAGSVSVFRDVARALSEELAPVRLEVNVTVGDLQKVSGEGYDFILLGLSLNELAKNEEERAILLKRWVASLRPNGALIVIEPALRETTRALQQTRDHLVAAGVSVFAPCTHAHPCPMLANERDWCHDEIDVRLPDALKEIARAAGLRFERLTFSYLTLRRDDAMLNARAEVYRVVSHPLKSKGKRELHLCGTQGACIAMRLDRHASESNASFEEARRGDLVAVDEAHAARIRVKPSVAFELS